MRQIKKNKTIDNNIIKYNLKNKILEKLENKILDHNEKKEDEKK